MFRILSCYFNDYRDREGKVINAEMIDNLESALEPLFIFAVTWSIGATCDYDGRIKFDKYLRDKYEQNKKGMLILPENDLLYDY